MQKYKFCSKISTKYQKTDISVKIKISVIGIEKKNLSINIDYRYRNKKFSKNLSISVSKKNFDIGTPLESTHNPYTCTKRDLLQKNWAVREKVGPWDL